MSNQYLAQHAERKNNLLALLADAQAYFAGQDKTGDASALQKHRQSIEEGLFSIVLIGEFSAGKSTFLNALMQKRILPSYTRETTAAVNFLRHTSKAPNGEAGIVYYRDGRQQIVPDLSVETLTKYVTVGGDSEGETVAETTERVDLFLESQFLEDGVMLVDSPGLNGITENLEEITRQQIKESHASIFMFSADRPGSKTDFETLRDLREQCSRIFIVLNKIDAIKAHEGETVEKVVAQLKANYSKQFPDSKTLPEIYPISAYQALLARDPDYQDSKQQKKDAEYCSRMEESSRMKDFEQRLYQYLVEGEKTREAFSAPVHALQAMLKRECTELDERLKLLSAERSPRELVDQKGEVEDKIALLRQQEQEQWKALRTRFQSSMRDVLDRERKQVASIVDGVNAEAESIEEVEELRDFAANLQEKLDHDCRRRLQQMDDRLREELQTVADEVSEQVLDGLEEAISSIPNIVLNFSPHAFQMTEMEIGSRLEADEEAFAKKKKEMERLREELREQTREKEKALGLEQKVEDMQRELRELAQRRNHIEDSFTIPDVERSTQEVRRTRARRGLFGKIAGLFVGDKEYTALEERVDSSKHDAAVEMRERRLAEVDEQQAQIRAEMRQYQTPEMGSRAFDIEIAERSERLKELHSDYQNALKRHEEKIAQDAARAMKRIRREIRSYAEERGEEFERAISAGLKAVEQQSYEAVRGMVSARVGDEIRRYEERLNQLIADSQASDAERDTKLQQAEEARSEVTDLMTRSAVFEGEIQSEMNDVIKEA